MSDQINNATNESKSSGAETNIKTADILETAKEKAGEALQAAKEMAQDVSEKAQPYVEKAKEVTGVAVEKAMETAEELWEKSKDGIQTGGKVADGSEDTRGIFEKISDLVTGDNIDDKTGKQVK